jgi:5-methylcytosine-specific restriction endonuclease McrA
MEGTLFGAHGSAAEDLIVGKTRRQGDALDDYDPDTPDRVNAIVTRYARDPEIRKRVKLRAKGKCEFCGEPGFISAKGTPYLECHHIIALAKDGADLMTNVIALCPKDHREAHFGERGEELERQMIQKVRIIEGRQ